MCSLLLCLNLNKSYEKYIYSALFFGKLIPCKLFFRRKNKFLELNDKPIAVTVNKSATNAVGSNATASGKLVAKKFGKCFYPE